MLLTLITALNIFSFIMQNTTFLTEWCLVKVVFFICSAAFEGSLKVKVFFSYVK